MQRTRQLLREPRPPRRAGHLPHQDRRAGRRRAARRRRRGARPRAPSPTASGACSACRKALDPPGEARDDIEILVEIARAARPRLGLRRPPRQVWDELRSLSPHARRHELRPARGARRHPVAVPRRGHARADVPARPAVGDDPVDGGRRAPFSRGRARAAGRRARRRVPAAAHHRPAARLVQHRRADRRLLARRCAAARRSTSRPRTPRGSASPTASSCAVSSRRGSVEAPVRIDRALRPGPRVHDLPLPRRGRRRTC